MKCVICKSGETQPGFATITLERNGTTIIVRDVPAQVCDNCGEQYVDGATTTKLLQQAEQAANSGIELEVRRFVAA